MVDLLFKSVSCVFMGLFWLSYMYLYFSWCIIDDLEISNMLIMLYHIVHSREKYFFIKMKQF